MEIRDASSSATKLLRQHGLREWSFRYDRALLRVGACFYRERYISLSRVFVEMNDEDVVRDTIRHEVAHALAWEHDRAIGHGAAWQKWCRVTGAKPRRCYEAEDVILPAARYQCTVLVKEVEWSRGSRPNQQTGTTRTSLEKGDVFGRHRLTKRLRAAVEIGLVEVLDTRTGEWIEGREAS